jgi:hypothetical protein
LCIELTGYIMGARGEPPEYALCSTCVARGLTEFVFGAPRETIDKK